MYKKASVLALGVLAVFALSACGGVDSPEDKPAANTGSASAAQSSAGAQSSPGLKAVDSALGKIVADQKGWTLYRFDKDTAKPPKATCVDQCATLWPVVQWSPDLKLDGIDKSVIGKVERPDGVTQLTINGWAVYRYSKDAKPGDTSGHGVGGTWAAVTPEGKKASQAPAAGSPAGSPTPGGYTY